MRDFEIEDEDLKTQVRLTLHSVGGVIEAGWIV